MLSYGLLPLMSMMIESAWYPTPQYLATTLSLIIVFGLFYGDFTKQLAQKEKELTEKQVAIMATQIQPHFLYNTLNTIYYLCNEDVEIAKKAINDFSDYLRINLSAINHITPIPFESELKHVRIYLQLECMRFEDLEVIYDIQTNDFLLPALSLQPLVENAVKHGIRSRNEGGTITISTCERDDCHEVIVRDDGMGFDVDHINHDGKVHIGIENVKREYNLCAMDKFILKVSSMKGQL